MSAPTSKLSSGAQSNISGIQFGMGGAYLIMSTNVKDIKEVLIGKRIEVTDEFSFDGMYVSEERKDKLKISGTWYIYTRKPIRDKRSYKITGYKLVLIRGSKNLCFAGEGDDVPLSQIGVDYNIPGFYDSSGTPTEGFSDLYVTLYQNVRIYRMIVNAALIAAELGFVPIFWPDGSITYEKIMNRPLVDPILQESILNAYEVPIMKTAPPQAGRLAKKFIVISEPPIILEYKISPGTIIEVPAGLVYELDQETDTKEYYIVRDLVITLESGRARYWPRISKIYLSEKHKSVLGKAYDAFIETTKKVFQTFFSIRKADEDEGNNNQQGNNQQNNN